MDEAEESEEMAALVALDELKAKYGSMMTAAEYKKRKKAILASFSGQMFASAGPRSDYNKKCQIVTKANHFGWLAY
jgi:hypothetical protein